MIITKRQLRRIIREELQHEGLEKIPQLAGQAWNWLKSSRPIVMTAKGASDASTGVSIADAAAEADHQKKTGGKTPWEALKTIGLGALSFAPVPPVAATATVASLVDPHVDAAVSQGGVLDPVDVGEKEAFEGGETARNAAKRFVTPTAKRTAGSWDKAGEVKGKTIKASSAKGDTGFKLSDLGALFDFGEFDEAALGESRRITGTQLRRIIQEELGKAAPFGSGMEQVKIPDPDKKFLIGHT